MDKGFESNESYSTVVKTIEEARSLIEAGFEYATYMNAISKNTIELQ